MQVIYGPHVTVIKSNLEDYLEKAPNTEYHAEESSKEVKSESKSNDNSEKKPVKTVIISSPITGVAADLSTTPDEAFSQGMMGLGAAMTPSDPIVRAPEDGEVAYVFDTKHAIGFVTDSGVNMLLHIGVDTVKLGGQGFEALVENGQKVKKGDPLLKLDIDYIKANAPSIVSPVLCTDLEDNQNVRLLKTGEVKAGDELLAVDFYE